MAGSGSPEFDAGDASGMRVAIVAARWHEEVMDGLIAGARDALGEVGAEEPTLVRVPGSFEVPIVAKRLARTHDAVVALGVVIKGGTPHFQYVCDAVTQGLARVALDTDTPIGFGILTCDNAAQARDRSGLAGSHESKGREAALSALETALTLRALG